jgi:aminobenzoyl-glutamate transport protein
MKRYLERTLNKFISIVEKGGNALPHPAALFGIIALVTLLISAIGHYLGWHGINPANGETIRVINLLSVEGLHKILLEMVNNYTGFAPLGVVMVALLGIGVAESSGLIKTSINALLIRAPKKWVTFIVVFAGILSNMASDVGYLLIIPLAGVIFHSMGRNPLAGMSAAFAGVSGGFSANLFIGSIDPLLAGLSTEAARIIDPHYYVMPTANYYFMVVSTFVIAAAGTWVNNTWIEPRLGNYAGNVEMEPVKPLLPAEKKGLKLVLSVFIIWLAVFCVGLIPNNGFLRGDDNSILHSPLLKGFIAVLFLVAASLGIIYGYTTKVFKNHNDVINGMTDSFKSLVSFLILVFFAAQFVAWFKWSNLGLVLAIKGANLLQVANIGMVSTYYLIYPF